mmetsp:Transcript_23928/g.35142  ORF Transcript_23928/g.35142 Transcript_23928/m.35142 type:complete len:148 (-) Transcript_23928:155-598(-)
MFAAGFRRQDGYSEGQRRVALAAWAASAFVFVSVATLLLVAQQARNGRLASVTSLVQWPTAHAPQGDEYTPARPDDIWFENGCQHFEQQRGIMMCADDHEQSATGSEVPPFGTNTAFVRGGNLIARGTLDGKVGTREGWNPPYPREE